jgi:hypothetical protein
MPFAAAGSGALVYAADERALLLVAEEYALQPTDGGGYRVALTGCRPPAPPGVVGGDWAVRPPPTDAEVFAAAARRTAVRLALPFGQDWLVLVAELAGDPAAQRDVRLDAASLPVPDPEALDDWPSPVAVTVPLPDGGAWSVRAHPRRKRLAAWRDSLLDAGPNAATWHHLLAAYDGGWTRPDPPPAEMADASGWDAVPQAVVDAVVAFLAASAAAMLERAGGDDAAAA